MDREGAQRRAGRLTAVERLLGAPERWPFEGVDGWWRRARPIAQAHPPADAAILLAGHADRLAHVFAGGYLAALDRLLPDRDRGRTAALCATEARGAHPRAIETRFDGRRVTGAKTFVTLAAHAQELLVLAREGTRGDGRPRLALVRVDAGAEGVSLEVHPPPPFVPEIEHAALRLDAAPAERLPGDGWTDYVKPFRTVEDVHVHLAFVAWLAAMGAREGWDRRFVEEALACVVALRALALADPASSATHLALAGAIETTRRLAGAIPWGADARADRARFERDRPLLSVAERARARRRELAWERSRR